MTPKLNTFAFAIIAMLILSNTQAADPSQGQQPGHQLILQSQPRIDRYQLLEVLSSGVEPIAAEICGPHFKECFLAQITARAKRSLSEIKDATLTETIHFYSAAFATQEKAESAIRGLKREVRLRGRAFAFPVGGDTRHTYFDKNIEVLITEPIDLAGAKNLLYRKIGGPNYCGAQYPDLLRMSIEVADERSAKSWDSLMTTLTFRILNF